MKEMEFEIKRLRTYKTAENVIWIGGFLIGIILLMAGFDAILPLYSVIFFVFLFASTFFVMSRKCPRCSNYFHGRGPIWGNTLRCSCLHCGLHISKENA